MKKIPEGPGVDSQSHSSIGSADDSAAVAGATSFQGAAPCGLSPTEQDSEQLCGWGALRPRALQVFNTPRWALFFLSVASFLQGFLINGLVNIMLTSVERRFDMSSSQSGLIVSSFDIASCICLPFVSYFGGQGHRPRWLGWGMVLMGLGSLVFALPHFTSPLYQATGAETSDLCPSSTTLFSQHKASDGLSHYFYVFILGQLLHGIGSTPLFTLGYTFLDENVKPNNAPVYMGVFYTSTVMGPSVGMLLGGVFLRVYSEVTVETELTPASPLWVGAWWIGFVLVAALSLPLGFAILSYPKKLPGSRDTAASCEAKDHLSKDDHHTSASNTSFGKALKDMPRSFVRLLRLPTFMFLCLAVTALNGQIAVNAAFNIKFLESQFSLSSSQASQILGTMAVPFIVGAVIGSFLVKRFQLKCRGLLGFCGALTLVGLFLYLMFLIHCPTASVAGVTVPYSSGQLGHVFEEPPSLQGLSSLRSVVEDELAAQCNSNCSCDRRRFSPVCGADDVMYYSPCFAGCTSTNLSGSGEVFSDCGCVGGNVSLDHGGSAVPGKCASSCSYLPVFLALYVLTSFCTGLSTVPNVIATLRCVPETQKSFALGIQWILVRTLGAIPAPIMFGSLIDQACLLRQSEGQGSCLLYENSQLSHYMLIAAVVYRALGVVFFVLALVFVKAAAEPAPNSEAADTTHLPPPGGAAVKQQTSL